MCETRSRNIITAHNPITTLLEEIDLTGWSGINSISLRKICDALNTGICPLKIKYLGRKCRFGKFLAQVIEVDGFTVEP